MSMQDETSPDPITAASDTAPTRRRAIGVMATAVAATTVGASVGALGAPAQAPAAPAPTPPAVPGLVPRGDLVNVLEYEPQAKLVLGAAKVAPILGSDRTITDRITLRPRVNIPTTDLDLTATLFGESHFTPILVGPISEQNRFHADGELATARGAAAAKAVMIVSSESSVPLADIAQAAGPSPLWAQVFAGSPKAKDTLAQATAAKCKAIVVTVNAYPSSATAVPAATPVDWTAVETLVKASALPVIVKGITRPADAKEAVARGAKGLIVSNYRGGAIATLTSPLLLIQPVVEAVGPNVPVLVDGSFRRGTDILKGLALGAKAVVLGRPVMWGLAAYGADGVQGVVEMLQTELARYMCMCGKVSLAAVTPQMVRIHAALPAATNSHA